MKTKNELNLIQRLEVKTLKAILNGQQNNVLQLFKKVEQLFVDGGNYSKTIISNSYILPLTRLLEMNYSWGREYLMLFPEQLKREYYKQVYSTAI